MSSSSSNSINNDINLSSDGSNIEEKKVDHITKKNLYDNENEFKTNNFINNKSSFLIES